MMTRYKAPEELQRIVDKWKPILEGPFTPLSACKVILLEGQEKCISRKDETTFTSFEERENYDNQ